jgi:hypothetical protein
MGAAVIDPKVKAALDAVNAARDEVAYRARCCANACAVYVMNEEKHGTFEVRQLLKLYTEEYMRADRAVDVAERAYRVSYTRLENE